MLFHRLGRHHRRHGDHHAVLGRFRILSGPWGVRTLGGGCIMALKMLVGIGLWVMIDMTRTGDSVFGNEPQWTQA